MKQKKVVLYDNTEFPSYEDYVEYCKCEGVEPEDENSNNYWEWVSSMEDLEWDDLKINLKYSKEAQRPCLIQGSCGLWNGTREIEPVRAENLFDAIKKCFGSCDYLQVEQEDGVINVTATHHDGSNCFTIQPLSKKGLEITNDYYNCDFSNAKPYWVAKYHKYII